MRFVSHLGSFGKSPACLSLTLRILSNSMLARFSAQVSSTNPRTAAEATAPQQISILPLDVTASTLGPLRLSSKHPQRCVFHTVPIREHHTS
ncbi:hypothetical protein CC86DRAFT_113299 [Ophiobolus disseminans]|uniref:Uncharacterized protein n=1 Tax=Ophiobolus disseminans TaxID=1469910 RepID=A0A6A6ZJL4_9PLEO|nr:hypothetical protein CC86DRAFT_113299 [Ophiobolus disseminans]